MTEKLYVQDAYLRQARAKVVRTETADGGVRVWLDRTIFYPEGGGQPADRGSINGMKVLDVQVEDGEVVHLLEADPGGPGADLVLDWARRFDHMQQHTAQHLLSQACVHLLDAMTLSFNMGTEHSSIEIGFGSVTPEQIEALEDECQAVIAEGRAVRVHETDDVSSLPLRKPPKVTGLIRVVEIDGYDWSACGGTHLRSSAEIGLLKIIRTDRVRDHARLYFTAGGRSLRDYRRRWSVVQKMLSQVNTSVDELPKVFEGLQREQEGLKKETKRLRRELLETEIQKLAAGGETLVVHELRGADSADARYVAGALAERKKNAVIYTVEPAGYLVIARGQGDCNLRKLSGELFGLLGGKGGGREEMIEGRGDIARLPELIARLRDLL